MTAASGFTNCACPCIQQALNNVVGRNAQALRRDKPGMISFLRSPENLSGTETVQLDGGKGKRRCVELNWNQKLCEATINESITDDCSTGTETLPFCETIDITKELETDNMVFDEDEMRRICAPMGETDEMWISTIINSQFNSLLTYWDKLVLTEILNNVGTFMDGDTIKAIQLFNTINSDAIGPRTRALANVQDEFDQAGLLGLPNFIGANEVNKWAQMIAFGTPNAAGQDVGMMAAGFNFFYDRFVEGIFGPNEFLVISPGSAQLLTWNRLVGNYAKANDVFEHGTIVDPYTGIRFDIKIHYNDCTERYYIKLQQNWELFVMPDEGDASCVDHYRVNGIFNYEACDDITECVDFSVS